MSHIHWVARQNKLEIPRDKDEVNKREIHECDGWAHDPDTMVAPLTPKPKRKVEALARTPPTIASRHKENFELRKWQLPRYCCARCILETKTKVKSTAVMVERTIQTRCPPHRHPNRHSKPKTSSGRHRPLSHVTKKTLNWGSDNCYGTVVRTAFLKLKQKSEVPQRKTRSYVPTRKSMSHPPHPNHTPTYPTLKPPSHQSRLHP